MDTLSSKPLTDQGDPLERWADTMFEQFVHALVLEFVQHLSAQPRHKLDEFLRLDPSAQAERIVEYAHTSYLSKGRFISKVDDHLDQLWPDAWTRRMREIINPRDRGQ